MIESQEFHSISHILRDGDTSLLLNDLGYYMDEGGHAVLPVDWTQMIAYMKKYLIC